MQRQVDQDKEINFYTAELKKIVDDLECRLEQQKPVVGSSDEIVSELRAVNDRLSSMEARSATVAIDDQENQPQSVERRAFGVLYASLVLYLFYRLLEK